MLVLFLPFSDLLGFAMVLAALNMKETCLAAPFPTVSYVPGPC